MFPAGEKITVPIKEGHYSLEIREFAILTANNKFIQLNLDSFYLVSANDERIESGMEDIQHILYDI
jgi:hypothetical protein